MNERNVVRLVEIRTSKGELLCSLQIKEMLTESGDNNPKDSQGNEKGKGKENELNKGGSSDNKEETMTYAQKRYLFRLLAERGIEGDEAHEYLKEKFKVESLKEVTKYEASQVIERLLREQKGGDSHDRSPK